MEYRLIRHRMKLANNGFSLIEMMVVAVIMGIMMMSGMMVFQNQTKANNFLELQGKKEQLRTALLSQVLAQSLNCKCLFNGSDEFPDAGVAKLTGFVQPTALGRFANPDCSGVPAIPQPLVTSAGLDGLKLSSVELTGIANVAGYHSGSMVVNITSTKSVLGPSNVQIKIPVNINVLPGSAAGIVKLEGCSAAASASGGGVLPEIKVVKATTNTSTAEVFCPAGFTRISCMGSRNKDLKDTCDEDGCGLVGVGPIDPDGCKIKIDKGSGTSPTVWATCARSADPVIADAVPPAGDTDLGDPELTLGGQYIPDPTPTPVGATPTPTPPPGSTPTPTPPPPGGGASCNFVTSSGTTLVILDGNSINAAATGSVPACEICDWETRTCTAGSLSGSYTHTSCSAGSLPSGSSCP